MEDFIKLLRSAPMSARFGMAVIVFYVVVAVFAPIISPYGETEIVGSEFEPWGGTYLLGTDNLGRDMLTRMLYGARNTIGIAFITTCLAFLIGGFLILLLGIYDDIKGANCYQKFIVQIMAGMIVILFGYKISAISIPFGGQLVLGVFSIPLTLFWIVGITNAINLIDGLDGLAAGISFGAACIMVFISLWFGNIASAFPAAILAGSLAAFLIFNFNPAKIFLGDSGSLTLGFMLACFSINGTFRDSSAVAMLIPIIVLGIPITDTLLAVVRRLLKGVHPFVADREHIHHRLLHLGMSHKKVVLLMNAVSYTWGVIGVVIFISGSRYSLALLLLILAMIVWGLRKMGFAQYFLIRKEQAVN